jgi:Toprim-like
MKPDRPWLSLADLERFDPQSRSCGRERRFLCPLCGETKPRDAAHRSLSLNGENGCWRCYRCEATGQLREWWPPRRSSRAQGTTHNAQRGGGAFSLGSGAWGSSTAGAPRRDAPATASTEEPPFDWEEYERQGRFQRLWGTPGEAYLARRGIPRGVAALAEVRFCRDWYGAPAVVFPLWSEALDLVGGHGRYLDARSEPRMRSSHGASGALFETAGAWEAPLLIVCEAPIDALSLAVCGFPAVALQGTRYPEWLPRRGVGRRVLLAHDADPAGDQAAAVLATALRSLGGQPERLRPAGAKDWNELLLAHGAEALREALRARLTPHGPAPAALLSEAEAIAAAFAAQDGGVDAQPGTQPREAHDPCI